MSEKILKTTELFLYLEEFFGENVGEKVLKSLMNSAISSNVGGKSHFLMRWELDRSYLKYRVLEKTPDFVLKSKMKERNSLGISLFLFLELEGRIYGDKEGYFFFLIEVLASPSSTV